MASYMHRKIHACIINNYYYLIHVCKRVFIKVHVFETVNLHTRSITTHHFSVISAMHKRVSIAMNEKTEISSVSD